MLACVRNLTLARLVVEARDPGGRGALVVACYGLVMYVAAIAGAWAAQRLRI